MPICNRCGAITSAIDKRNNKERWFKDPSDRTKLICQSCMTRSRIPWNKGKKTGQKVWNKGLKGLKLGYKKGTKFSPEHCANISKALKGKIPAHIDKLHTPEVWKKISDTKRGKPSPKKGKPSGQIPWNFLIYGSADKGQIGPYDEGNIYFYVYPKINATLDINETKSKNPEISDIQYKDVIHDGYYEYLFTVSTKGDLKEILTSHFEVKALTLYWNVQKESLK